MPHPMISTGRALLGGGDAVQPPGGWLWTLPFTIYRGTGLPGGFDVGGWDVSSLAPSGGTDIYVSLLGNDTTGNGSSANPYRSVKKASTMVAAGSTIWVAPGIYSFVSTAVYSGWDGFGPTGKSYSVKVWGAGDVVFSNHQNLVYALDPGLTFAYKGALLSLTIARVFDAIVPDANGDYAELTLVANAATVDTTPGSWYSDGTSLWIRLSDDRVPDADVRPYTAGGNGLIKRGSTVYVENCRFEGGVNNMTVTSDIAGQPPSKGYFKNCAFKYSSFDGLEVFGSTCIAQNCTASRAKYDNFHGDELASDDPSGWSPAYVALIDCLSLYAGTGGSADNACSLHGGAAVVTPGHWLSINGDYSHSDGPECSHIELARCWHLGDHTHDTDPASSANYRMSAGTMWLDTCWSEDATWDILLFTNSVCYKHNCTDAGLYSVEAGSTLSNY